MKNEITVLHAEQIAPQKATRITQLQTESDFQAHLQNHLGCHCVCEFLLGNGQCRIQEGILQEIGQNYLLLYQEDTHTTIACQCATLQFITCRPPNFHP